MIINYYKFSESKPPRIEIIDPYAKKTLVDYNEILGSLLCDMLNLTFPKIGDQLYNEMIELDMPVLKTMIDHVFLYNEKLQALTAGQRLVAFNAAFDPENLFRSFQYKAEIKSLLDVDGEIYLKFHKKLRGKFRDSFDECCKFIAENNIHISPYSFYAFDNYADLLLFYLNEMINSNVIIKKCENCRRYFVPANRLDTKYCDNKSPQDFSKTCKEYGALEAYKNKLKSNKAAGLYRSIYMQKQMLTKRNPDINEYKEDFEQYKADTKRMKRELKQGIISEDLFIEWLENIKKG